jgi:hypothetical protein
MSEEALSYNNVLHELKLMGLWFIGFRRRGKTT